MHLTFIYFKGGGQKIRGKKNCASPGVGPLFDRHCGRAPCACSFPAFASPVLLRYSAALFCFCSFVFVFPLVTMTLLLLISSALGSIR
jgi:hypothetical protein